MRKSAPKNLLSQIEELKERLNQSEQLIEAIKGGEVDAFAIRKDNQAEVFTLQSGDYAYRILVENAGAGALNLTEEGLIVYTNSYFHNLINQSYDKTVGSYIFSYIHPDSRNSFNELFKSGIAGQAMGEIRFLVNGRIIPTYVSLTSLLPKLATIGMIITDLSEKKRREQELEQKNLELEHTNTELASFTYIASHDLQEPLRKIQTFSNRILEKENGNFSEKTRDYFNRIISASERMQSLIISLLRFSQTSTAEMTFIPSDLNVIILDVKNNLKEIIEETQTVIESTGLPILQVAPDQIIQLFTNIILNAIKYRKPGKTVFVRISAEPASRGELFADGFFSNQNYYRITVEDNGIGFEQQYALKIFDLFQRLHGRSEYQGTGIGLAICKKIIQNHEGFIKAEAAPGKGASFIIYLPVRNDA